MANEDALSKKSRDALISELVTKLTEGVTQSLMPYIERHTDNLRRARALIEAAKAIKAQTTLPNGGSLSEDAIHIANDIPGDILRAAVVFTHASLEDFLRTIAATLLPDSSEEVLNEIPLKGVNITGRPEKFLLGRLVQHKGKLIEDLIRESVDQYLERSNFNDVGEVNSILQELGFNVDRVKDTYSDLHALMQRRHQIVHRADRTGTLVEGHLQDIEPDEAIRWLEATSQFTSQIIIQLAEKQTQRIAKGFQQRPKKAAVK